MQVSGGSSAVTSVAVRPGTVATDITRYSAVAKTLIGDGRLLARRGG